MFAIVSLLDSETSLAVQRLWNDLETDCGLTGIRVTPYPHFSWHAATEYREDPIQHGLRSLAKELEPFTIRTTGLGVFTGSAPVIYIPIVKDLRLITLQQRIYEMGLPHAQKPNSYLTPELWIPHITLGIRDLTKEKLTCAIERLFIQDFNWEIRIDNFALVCQEDHQVGELIKVFDFGDGD